MMGWLRTVALAACAMASIAVTCQADYIRVMVYGRPFWFQGQARVLPRGMVNIYLPDLDVRLVLRLRDASEDVYVDEIIKAPSLSQQFSKRLVTARRGSIDDCFEFALWVAERGLTDRFEEVLELMEEKAPDDDRVKELREFWTAMKEEIPEKDYQRDHIREVVGSGMEFITSAHYLLAHDPPGKERAEVRLQLMERVYESFYLWFYLKGRKLKFPEEKLMVTLYGDHENYMLMVNRTDPELRMAAGFWSRLHNVAVYYAQDTTQEAKQLRGVIQQMERNIEEARRQGERRLGSLIREQRTLEVIVDLLYEGEEIEVVTHEGCHQLVGNSGLLPRQVAVPLWVHEGLAAFFESPRDASWAGIGAVNERRIETYRALKKLKNVCNLDFIASDRIFTRAANVAALDAAYGPAWALTHYMMNKRFDQFMQYYDALGRLPADMPFSDELLLSVFKEVFGEKLTDIEQEWHFYMSNLRTLEEQLEGEEE